MSVIRRGYSERESRGRGKKKLKSKKGRPNWNSDASDRVWIQ